MYDIQNWEWSWGHAGSTGLDAIGIIPIVGVIKNVKHADEIVLLVKNGERVEVVSGVRKRVEATQELISLELPNGHSLLKHVGLTDEQMLLKAGEAIASGSNARAISTFTDAATEKAVYDMAIAKYQNEIGNWLIDANRGPGSILTFQFKTDYIIGRGIALNDFANNQIEALTDVVIRLVKRSDGTYGLHTAYPTDASWLL